MNFLANPSGGLGEAREEFLFEHSSKNGPPTVFQLRHYNCVQSDKC